MYLIDWILLDNMYVDKSITQWIPEYNEIYKIYYGRYIRKMDLFISLLSVFEDISIFVFSELMLSLLRILLATRPLRSDCDTGSLFPAFQYREDNNK